MYRLFLALFIVLSLSACSASNKPKNTQGDLGKFRATFYHNPVEVQLELYESRELLNQQYQILIDELIKEGKADKSHKGKVRGFSIFNKENNKCIIHVVKPDSDDQTVLEYGHEFMHCVFGRWHVNSHN